MRATTIAIISLLLATSAQAAPILHSFPGATNKLYLDCLTVPWDASDEAIAATWQIVANYYNPFNVDVTTEYPGLQPNVAWLLMGGPLRDGVLGYAGLNNWRLGTLAGPALAGYVFCDGLNDNPLQCGEVAAHEGGHEFGLPHEDSGLMYYALIPEPPPQWTAFDISYLGNPDVLGFAPVPEPSMLLSLLSLLLMRRLRNGDRTRRTLGTNDSDGLGRNDFAAVNKPASIPRPFKIVGSGREIFGDDYQARFGFHGDRLSNEVKLGPCSRREATVVPPGTVDRKDTRIILRGNSHGYRRRRTCEHELSSGDHGADCSTNLQTTPSHRSNRQSHPRPSSCGTSTTSSIDCSSTPVALRTAASRSGALTYATASTWKSPQPSRRPLTRQRFILRTLRFGLRAHTGSN